MHTIISRDNHSQPVLKFISQDQPSPMRGNSKLMCGRDMYVCVGPFGSLLSLNNFHPRLSFAHLPKLRNVVGLFVEAPKC